VLAMNDVHCDERHLQPRAFIGSISLPSASLEENQSQPKTKMPRHLKAGKDSIRSSHVHQTPTACEPGCCLHPPNRRKQPSHWLPGKKSPGTKEELTGTNQRHIRVAWSGHAPSMFTRKLTFSSSLVILLLGLLPGCSAQPQSHPLDTKPVPADAQFLTECSIKGVMACKFMSAISGDYGAEKRSACIAYRDSNGKLVEQCGSVPARQP